MIARCLAVLLLVALPRIAAQPARGGAASKPFQAVSGLTIEDIIERSPARRYEKKDYMPGVLLLRGAKRCTADDVVNLYLLQKRPQHVRIPDSKEVFRDRKPNERTKDLSITAVELEILLMGEVTRLLRMFSDDPVVKMRELYVTTAVFPQPNAVSISLGFLVFDPQLFFQIAGHEKTNGWSIRAIVAHEFAHQLQFWHDEPLLKRTRNGQLWARDKELQADCIASTILTRLRDEGLTSDRKEDDQFENFAEALRWAFISLGDFELEDKDHHGTSYERMLMVEYGHENAGALKILNNPRSSGLLDRSRSRIEAMNKLYGDTIWPTGKRL